MILEKILLQVNNIASQKLQNENEELEKKLLLEEKDFK